jgi:hypothetical protein
MWCVSILTPQNLWQMQQQHPEATSAASTTSFEKLIATSGNPSALALRTRMPQMTGKYDPVLACAYCQTQGALKAPFSSLPLEHPIHLEDGIRRNMAQGHWPRIIAERFDIHFQ